MDSGYNNNLPLDTSVLPLGIFMRLDDDFFSIVQSLGGDSLVSILKIQLSNSANKLLNTVDVFAFFRIDSVETDVIKSESCFKSKAGQYMIKPGIQASLLYSLTLLKAKLKEQEMNTTQDSRNKKPDLTDEFVDKHPILKTLIKWCQYKDSSSTSGTKNDFITMFIDNLVSNHTRSSNNYRYAKTIKKFSMCLYILGGKQAYEFIRLNLSGSIPNLTTISDLINESSTNYTEAQFRFELLEKYHSSFGFCAEDTTGAIRKVEYDSSANSFIGFTTPLVDGVPSSRSFHADTFDEFKRIYRSNELAPSLNVHMFQSIPTADGANVPRPFLLSAYGIDNAYSSIDIVRRWIYIFDNCLNEGVRLIGFSSGRNIQGVLRVTYSSFE